MKTYGSDLCSKINCTLTNIQYNNINWYCLIPDYKLTPMGYFLFLQEKRMTVRGWGNKTIAELQILCDPLWRALSKEEKAKYKHEKKRAKRMELDQAVKERQAQELMEKQAALLASKTAADPVEKISKP